MPNGVHAAVYAMKPAPRRPLPCEAVRHAKISEVGDGDQAVLRRRDLGDFPMHEKSMGRFRPAVGRNRTVGVHCGQRGRRSRACVWMVCRMRGAGGVERNRRGRSRFELGT